MSKLGKKPITIPKDTKVKVENGKLFFTGPKGSREILINDKIWLIIGFLLFCALKMVPTFFGHRWLICLNV